LFLAKRIFFIIYVVLMWVPSSLIFFCLRAFKRPIHIIYCMVDHYEPGTGGVDEETARQRVALLLSEYPRLADKHRDYAGNIPKRTWFFPPHYHSNYHLRHLVSLCEKGYGEIEFHLHHGKYQPDTSENLENTIRQAIKEYSEFGIFGTENGEKKYGFIHGDWALDNSRNGKFCGVNNEITILKRTNCYADFTFPSGNEASPLQINSIFYAKDDPEKPKSHNRGATVKKSGNENGDLMIIQGPLYPFFKDGKLSRLRVFRDKIDGCPSVTSKMVKAWVKTGISVAGKRDWIIIKTHTHGATDNESVLGKEMDDIFSCLEKHYNDGNKYILHYVTSRELYNIIKAIEAGESGDDPEKYRNYKILPPLYDSSPDIAAASEKLRDLIAKTYR